MTQLNQGRTKSNVSYKDIITIHNSIFKKTIEIKHFFYKGEG